MDLKILGWNAYFAEHLNNINQASKIVGRVTGLNKDVFRVMTVKGESFAKIAGRLRFEALESSDYPAVGDWVVIKDDAGDGEVLIEKVLPRKSKFSRKESGKLFREQVVAANVDIVFLVTALNKNYNLRRLERYLTLSWDSGASPVIILSKSDLCADVSSLVWEVENIAAGVPVHAVSVLQKEGLEIFDNYLKPGKTAVFLGSSGVGKSTLVNYLTGKDLQKVDEIRAADDKGRHTTTSRELIILPQGGIVIDTPGMRELQLWGTNAGVNSTFEEIIKLAENCHFKDCSHENEPGCAVRRAIEEGELEYSRYLSYLKQQKEISFLEDQKNYLKQKEMKMKGYRNILRKKRF